MGRPTGCPRRCEVGEAMCEKSLCNWSSGRWCDGQAGWLSGRPSLSQVHPPGRMEASGVSLPGSRAQQCPGCPRDCGLFLNVMGQEGGDCQPLQGTFSLPVARHQVRPFRVCFVARCHHSVKKALLSQKRKLGAGGAVTHPSSEDWDEVGLSFGRRAGELQRPGSPGLLGIGVCVAQAQGGVRPLQDPRQGRREWGSSGSLQRCMGSC